MNEADSIVRLDLNDLNFQKSLFNLEKESTIAVLNTMRKIATMTWKQIYNSPGLQWELLRSKVSKTGTRLYSFRISKGFRAIACREGDFLRIVGLFPDHDTAYKA